MLAPSEERGTERCNCDWKPGSSESADTVVRSAKQSMLRSYCSSYLTSKMKQSLIHLNIQE